MGKATELRYRRFAAEFFKDLNACRAYQEAGFRSTKPNVIRANAARLLSSASIQPYLSAEFERLQSRLDLQQDRAMLEICRLAYSSLNDVARWGPDGLDVYDSENLPDNVTAAVQEVSSVKKIRMFTQDDITVTEEEVRTRVKLHSKLPALKMLQEYFRRGDPLSAEAEASIQRFLLVMSQYVPRDRLDNFRAEVFVQFGIDLPIPTGD